MSRVRSSLAAKNTYQPVGFNVKAAAYGAKGDGVTDDTAAIQAAINACYAAGGGVVFFPDGIYQISGALRDTSTFNAQLEIPITTYNSGTTDKPMAIELRGQTPPARGYWLSGAGLPPVTGAILRSSLAGSGSFPAMISCGLRSAMQNFTHLTLTNLTLRGPNNPSLTMLQASSVNTVSLNDVVVDTNVATSAIVRPTNLGVALDLPTNSNGAVVKVESVYVIGYYKGMIVNEHLDASDIFIHSCEIAVEVGAGAHAARFGRLLTTWCPTVIKATGVHSLQIDQLAIEHANQGTWRDPINDVDDASNYLSGRLSFQVVKQGVGADFTFTKNGALNLACFGLQAGQTGREMPPSFVRAYKSAGTVAITSATHTAIALDAESIDTDGFHSTVTNTSRLTIPVAGYYRLSAGLAWVETAGGFRFAGIWKNGVGTGTRIALDERMPVVGDGTAQTITAGPILCAAGDYIELGAYTSVASCSVSSGAHLTWLAAELAARS